MNSTSIACHGTCTEKHVNSTTHDVSSNLQCIAREEPGIDGLTPHVMPVSATALIDRREAV